MNLALTLPARMKLQGSLTLVESFQKKPPKVAALRGACSKAVGPSEASGQAA